MRHFTTSTILAEMCSKGNNKTENEIKENKVSTHCFGFCWKGMFPKKTFKEE